MFSLGRILIGTFTGALCLATLVGMEMIMLVMMLVVTMTALMTMMESLPVVMGRKRDVRETERLRT